MALTTDALKQVQSLLETEVPVGERIANLRQAFPGVSLTRCDAGDIDTETPVLETTEFNVYLVDTSEHCVRVTEDPARATGLILAEKR